MSNRSNYCKHGTYIGDPYGPDYMCHWCEMGYEPPERILILQPDDIRGFSAQELVELLDALQLECDPADNEDWQYNNLYVLVYPD